jgi:hypothetical protein
VTPTLLFPAEPKAEPDRAGPGEIMTEPPCPGCRERDLRIAELQRQVSQLQASRCEPPKTVGEAPIDTGTTPATAAPEEGTEPRRSRRVRHRVRVIADEGKVWRHRWRKRLRRLAPFGLWAVTVLIGILLIFLLLSLLSGGSAPL